MQRPSMQTQAVGTFGRAQLRTCDLRCQLRARTRECKVFGSSSNGSGQVVLVDGLVVQPAYRSTPWEAEQKLNSSSREKALVMFVSESCICRAPLAAAIFKRQLMDSPLQEWMEVQQRATRDYCLGEAPDAAAVAAAAALGVQLPDAETAAAVVFDPANDIVAADLVLVMDKFTAADVLREVSSYDLINPGGQYSARVRLLGSYHPRLAAQADQTDGQDIDDPLYGNVGGEQEQAAVLEVAEVLQDSCSCLLQKLEQVAEVNGLLEESPTPSAAATASGNNSQPGRGAEERAAVSAGARFREVLIKHVREEGVISWLVPPMLQGSSTDVGGWV